jgi:hypothetical protein
MQSAETHDLIEHRVPLVSIAEQEHLVSELRRVEHSTPAEQMKVVKWAMQYADHYYLTRRGEMRRVFPKGRLLRAKVRRHHAANQS